MKTFQLQKKYVDYLDSTRSELLEAEKTIDRIKKSNEWKACINYFNVLYCRKKIVQAPTKENGYTFKLPENLVVLDLNDLAKIVTPEQLAEIKAKTRD